MKPLTGKLVWAGNLNVNGDEVIGVTVEVPKDVLMSSSIEMYQDVEVSPKGVIDHLLQELRNIANATPEKWDDSVRDQFREWAQNRARSAIKEIEGGEQ